MKSFLTAEKVLIFICLLVLGWGAWFSLGVRTKAVPEVKIKKLTHITKEDQGDQDFLQKVRDNLEKLRQPVELISSDEIKAMRNPFMPPVKEERVQEWKFCEECGGRNKSDAAICIHCGALFPRDDLDTDNDGMPNYWEIQYEFDPEDPDDAPLDKDGDGFSNLEEFRNGTNPLLADGIEQTSVPFSLVRTYKKPIQILFMGYLKNLEGSYELQVNWAGKTEFFKIGDMVRGYEIKEFKKNIVEVPQKSGISIYDDVSFIICQRKKFEAKKFMKGKLVTENDSFAKIRFTQSGQELEVYIGYIIEDKASGQTYTVSDIGLRPQKIKVVDENKKDYTVRLRTVE